MFSLSLHYTNQVIITICVLQTARECLSHLKTLRTDSENCICYLRKQFVWIPGAYKDTVTLSLSRHWGCCSSGSRTKCTQRCFTESTHVLCLEKPWGQQKPLKPSHLSKVSQSQALLFSPRVTELQHSTHPAPIIWHRFPHEEKAQKDLSKWF